MRTNGKDDKNPHIIPENWDEIERRSAERAAELEQLRQRDREEAERQARWEAAPARSAQPDRGTGNGDGQDHTARLIPASAEVFELPGSKSHRVRPMARPAPSLPGRAPRSPDAGTQADTEPKPVIRANTVSARIVNALPTLDPEPGKMPQPSYRPACLRLEDSGVPEALNAEAPGAWDLLELLLRNADREASGVARPRFSTLMRRLGLQNRKATWQRIHLLERGKRAAGIPALVKRVQPDHPQRHRWIVLEAALIQWVKELGAAKATRKAARSMQNRANGRRGLAARYGTRRLARVIPGVRSR